MELIEQEYLYYPEKPGKKAFCVVPRGNVAGSERVQFDRAVAFGVVADKINELWVNGCRSIVVQKARKRNRNQFGQDLQLVILADGTTDELYAQRQGQQATPAELLPVEEASEVNPPAITADNIPF